MARPLDRCGFDEVIRRRMGGDTIRLVGPACTNAALPYSLIYIRKIANQFI